MSSNTCHIFVSEDSTYILSSSTINIYVGQDSSYCPPINFTLIDRRTQHIVLQHISHLCLGGFYPIYFIVCLEGFYILSSNTFHIYVREDSTYCPPIHFKLMTKMILHIALKYISHLCLRGFYISSSNTFHMYIM